MSNNQKRWRYEVGHVIDVLRDMEEESVQCVVTSPPYWGLRKYSGEQEVVWGGDEDCEHEWGEEKILQKCGKPSQAKGIFEGRDMSGIQSQKTLKQGRFCQKCDAWRGGFGLEPTPEMYVEHTVQILREIRRVLRDDGVVFWNLGDSYSGVGHGQKDTGKCVYEGEVFGGEVRGKMKGLKPKDLVLVPSRVALAAQADGWWIRSIIIWNKNNPMPESVTDRPTTAHEYIILMSKSKRYFWDADAVREKLNWPDARGVPYGGKKYPGSGVANGTYSGKIYNADEHRGRNLRSVWTMATQPYPEAHFATFPEEIPRRCIKAGTSEKGNCPECGAPWVRTVQKKSIATRDTTDTKFGSRDDDLRGPVARERRISERRTLGWKPTCDCYPRTDEWLEDIEAGPDEELSEEELEENERRGRVRRELLELWEGCDTVPAVVLDPFCGSGTVLKVARELDRDAIGIDISDEYKELATRRANLDVPDITRYGGDE